MAPKPADEAAYRGSAPLSQPTEPAVTRAAARRAEDTPADEGRTAPPPTGNPVVDFLADRCAKLLVRHEELLSRADVQDDKLDSIMRRLDKMEGRLESGAPSRTPSPTGAGTKSKPTDSKSAAATEESSKSSQGTSPWSHWDSQTRSEVSMLLDRHGLNLTSLFGEPTDGAHKLTHSPAPPPQKSTTVTMSPAHKPLQCRHESLGSFDGDPLKLETFLRRVGDIARSNRSL